MGVITQPRKLLARLEPQSLSLVDSKPRRKDVGTAYDARQHSPPDPKHDKKWQRIEKALRMLREGLKGQAGPFRIHPAAQTRSLRDPEAMATIDIAGALAFAAKHPDGPATNESARNQLAIAVYLYRNWPSFETQHQQGVLLLVKARFSRMLKRENDKPWSKKFLAMERSRQNIFLEKMALAVLDEFMRPEHCVLCGGYGLEITGPRTGKSCSGCGGRGIVPWSANGRAKAARVRRRDWDFWSRPYLAMLDYLNELERTGSDLHVQALDDG